MHWKLCTKGLIILTIMTKQVLIVCRTIDDRVRVCVEI